MLVYTTSKWRKFYANKMSLTLLNSFFPRLMMIMLMKMQVCVQHIQRFHCLEEVQQGSHSARGGGGWKIDRSDEGLNLVATKLQSSEGKFSAYDKHFAQELESLPNEMAMFCRRVINEAIFEAQMGTLNRTSRVVTDPHYPQSTDTPQEYIHAEPPSHVSNPNNSVGQLFASFQK
jgi:hypothetical protein